MRATVATFSTERISYGTVSSLLSLGDPARLAGIYPIQYAIGSGALIEKERSVQATWFLDNPELCGDVFFMIDSDISFFNPADCIRMIKNCAILRTVISGVYVKKEFPPRIIAVPFTKTPIYMNSGLKMMKWVPTGFMAIHRCVLQDLAKTMRRVGHGNIQFYPFFMTKILHTPEKDIFLGEDNNFSYSCNEIGYYPLLDTNTMLYHTGPYDFSVEDIGW